MKSREFSGLGDVSLARLAAEVHNLWRWISAFRLEWIPGASPLERAFQNEDSHCYIVVLIALPVRRIGDSRLRAAEHCDPAVVNLDQHSHDRAAAAADPHRFLGWRRAQPGQSDHASICQQEVRTANDPSDQRPAHRIGRDYRL